MTKPTTPRTSPGKTALGQASMSGLSSDRPAREKSGNQPVHHIRQWFGCERYENTEVVEAITHTVTLRFGSRRQLGK